MIVYYFYPLFSWRCCEASAEIRALLWELKLKVRGFLWKKEWTSTKCIFSKLVETLLWKSDNSYGSLRQNDASYFWPKASISTSYRPLYHMHLRGLSPDLWDFDGLLRYGVFVPTGFNLPNRSPSIKPCRGKIWRCQHARYSPVSSVVLIVAHSPLVCLSCSRILSFRYYVTWTAIGSENK